MRKQPVSTYAWSSNGSPQQPEIPLPDLLELQRNSYDWFLEEGLLELLHNFSPIEDFTGTMVLEFLDFSLGEPKYPEEECTDRDVTYEAPLRVKVRLVNKKTGEMKEAEVYMGELPLMTVKGTFIINGAERVVVSQLVRSPGVYFRDTVDISGATLYSAQLIPADGGWMEFDIGANQVLSVKIGQTRKFPFTVLLRAISSIEASDPLPREPRRITPRRKRDLVGRVTAGMVLDTQTGDLLAEEGIHIDEGIAERILAAASTNDILVLEKRRRCLTDEDILLTFGDEETLRRPKADDLQGKYALEAITRKGMASPLVAPFQKISEEMAKDLEEMELSEFHVLRVDPVIERTLEHDLSGQDGADADEIQAQALEHFYKSQRPSDQASRESGRSLLRSTFFDHQRYNLARVGRYKINRKLAEEFERLGVSLPEKVRSITVYDVIATVRYLLGLRKVPSQGTVDDIDHLENKRVRAVGELLAEQMRLGMLRLERVARERMTQLSPEEMRPQDVISIKPIAASVRSFFASGQLSQFMDQTNPLSELTHKRKLSAMGPGGLSRRNAKLEVRDVHRSHYGRICPIMTPEGSNIGLINSLATYARVNRYGFVETPYRRVEDSRVTDEVIYLDASRETRYNIAPSGLELDRGGRIVLEEVVCRRGNAFPLVPRDQVDLMDVSPLQVFSDATCLIPYLENDDANRALMGSNMQRQAVPLVRTEPPYVKTGIEAKIARDSGALLLADAPGVVTYVDGNRIAVITLDGKERAYRLHTFERTNQSTYIHQQPLVHVGDVVQPGDVMAQGPATYFDELALGRNVTVAFISWEGYNFEDAIIISDRLVKDDIYTSVHIEKYEIQARDTKLGAEEITADIPNVGEEALRHLDERGIIRIGAEVKTGDILVGKVAPKGQSELTAEEKLVVAIFGKKAEEMRDSSLRMPHGAKGKVLAVGVLSRYKYECQRCGHLIEMGKADMTVCPRCTGGDLSRLSGDELPPGVNQLVRVYVAERRKIMVGDKMAGRHGNKGVISRIVPAEDMPYLADGTPVDIILNPLGVPSRMNIGQILETHLGEVARHWNVTFVSPIFNSIPEPQVMEWLRQVTRERRERILRDYLLTELPVWEGGAEETRARRQEWSALDEDALERLRADYPDLPEPLWRQSGRAYRVEMLLEAWRSTTGPPSRLWQAPLEEVRQVARERLAGLDPEALHLLGERLATPIEVWEEASPEERLDLVLARIEHNVEQRVGFNPDTAKTTLYDGRTGEPFDQPVCVGSIYILKLHHLVEDKIHARSTGPYSLVTQQPLGGKAQFGGQRFGEMEVWALEAYGAAYTLQEILTVKSDDVTGRVKSYEAIVKGVNIMEPGIPESFKILIKELQGLGLRVNVETKEGQVVDLRDAEEEEEKASAPGRSG